MLKIFFFKYVCSKIVFSKKYSSKTIYLNDYNFNTLFILAPSTHKLADHKLEDMPSLTIKLALKILNLYIIGIA